MFLDIITSFPVFIVEQFILKMDAREPIPILLKRFNVRIPMINVVPYIGIKWAGVAIGVLTALTYTGLLIWSLFPPTKLAILPGKLIPYYVSIATSAHHKVFENSCRYVVRSQLDKVQSKINKWRVLLISFLSEFSKVYNKQLQHGVS